VFIVVRFKCDPLFSVISEMTDLKEQGFCVRFCSKLRRTATKTHEMLKTAFGDSAMGKTQTSEWFSRLKRGENSVEDSEHRRGECSQNHQRRPTKHHYGDCWQVRPLVWNMPAHSN
jgi:hypothetical protein